MKRFTSLKIGDRIGVCAPSGSFDPEKLKQGSHVLKDLGFKVTIPEEIFQKKRYLAGDDEMRADVINRLFSDPDIDGIICARGGFGAMRTLEYINWAVVAQNPKPFVGFSDNTALLLAIAGETGHMSIHGPNLTSLAAASKETMDSFYRVLTGTFDTIRISDGKTIHPGRCSGVLKGGNMAVISHLSGTRYQPDFTHAVLFLEDINEPAYKIDRMMTQMKMGGVFDGVRGVVTGSFEGCDNQGYIDEILFEIFAQSHIPVLSGLESGHGKNNLSLCMGGSIQMDTQTASIHWI